MTTGGTTCCWRRSPPRWRRPPRRIRAGTAGPTLWQEGVNYTRLVPAQPTDVPAGQVEVLEFFWYACPHCYALDPWSNLEEGQTAVRQLRRAVPVTWSEGHRALAR